MRSTALRLQHAITEALKERENIQVATRVAVTGASGRMVRRLLNKAGLKLVRADDHVILPRGRFDVVARDYYSPIPDLSQLPASVWERCSDLGGVELAAGAAIDYVERDLAPFIAELDVPREYPGAAGQFFLRNDTFESVDAELLYGVVRKERPSRVIELGSGYSTLLISLACQRNAQDGVHTVHQAFDPYPREQVLGDRLPDPSRLVPIKATEVPLDTFASLKAGDILFVDTTHTVKLGSEVNYLVLDVLPCLAPGVLIHFHDVFLPWEYPKQWFTEMGYNWSEQYLLQAFLAYNREFEVLLPAQTLARGYPERLGRVITSFSAGASPGSMWLRRRAGGSQRAHGQGDS